MSLNNVNVLRAIADQEIIHIKRAFKTGGDSVSEYKWGFQPQTPLHGLRKSLRDICSSVFIDVNNEVSLPS